MLSIFYDFMSKVSHSTNLLSNTLLRPDQIYTVDFIDGKGSKLNRLEFCPKLFVNKY